MKNPTPIATLLPQAMQMLAHPTQPKPESIDRATKWLLGSGWGMTGQETKEEEATLMKSLASMSRWLAEWLDGLEPRWIVLIGVSGTGKTMLARRAADMLRNTARNVFDRHIKPVNETACLSYWQEGSAMIPWRDLVPHGEDNIRRYERSKKDWYKVIDDLKPQTGQEIEVDGDRGVQPKRFEVNAAGDLLDSRIRKWTVVTSNLTRAQLAKFWDVRIASRLMRDGNEIVDMSEVSDFGLRLEKAQKS